MRRIATFSALLALLPVGCGNTAHFTLALGTTGSLPTWQGECLASSARGDAVVVSGDGYEARAVGTTTLTCRDGTLALDVLAVERIEIEGPEVLPPHGASFRLVAYGARDRMLDLGSAPGVTWSVSDNLSIGASCNHMLGTCASSTTLRIRSSGGGDARITARLGRHEATRSLRAPR